MISFLRCCHKVIVSLLFFVVAFEGCAPKVAPYSHGPVMSQKDVTETFRPILSYMEVTPGMTFGDVGAGSGVFTVMMATMLDHCKIYIQDIDTITLQRNNLNKMVEYYSTIAPGNFTASNDFHIAIGNETRTNLPDNAFDRIWMNGTIHVFSQPDSMVMDLARKLKPNGLLYIRDNLKKNREAIEYCSPECRKPLLGRDEFMSLMKKNGFTLVKETPNMSGSPVFAFALKE